MGKKRLLKKVSLAGMLIIGALIFGNSLLANAGGYLAAPVPQNLDGWERYKDERFQINFAYPKDWYLNVIPSDPAGGGIQISNYAFNDSSRNQKTAPTDYLKIEIMVIGGDPKSSHQSIAEWRHSRADYDPSTIKQEYSMLINDLEGWEEVTTYSSDKEFITIYLPYQDDIYGDTMIFITATPFPNPEFEKIYYTLVSTLSFDE